MRLLIVNLLLLAALAAQVMNFADVTVPAVADARQAAREQAAAQDVSVPAPSLEPLPGDLVAVVEQRPLFTETRRPPAPPPEPEPEPEPEKQPQDEAEEEPPPEPLKAVLRAIVRDGQGGWVLLQQEGEPEVTRVEPGDTVQGWTLGEITANGATFHQDDRNQALKLRDFD